MKGKILLIEDEELVGTMVRMNLETDGYEVEWHKDGEQGLLALRTGRFDLVLLDISLPGMDGMALLTEARRAEISTPIMMLTARSDVKSKVSALEVGADDYLPKPFDVEEMLARVRAILRRSQGERELPASLLVRIGGHEINLVTREASTNEGPVILSEKEVALLKLLVRANGQVLSRADILDEAWGMEATPTARTVDNFILRLRKLFEPDAENPRHFVTVRGSGYRLVI